jgi:hypothetical protein
MTVASDNVHYRKQRHVDVTSKRRRPQDKNASGTCARASLDGVPAQQLFNRRPRKKV